MPEKKPAKGGSASGRKKDILVVEDDQFLVKVYMSKLKKEGYDVRIAYDGNEGIAEVEKKKPDIILLDLILPGMDGFEVLKKIKEKANLNKVPIIILSNLGQSEDIKRGEELGADDYFVKANTSLSAIIEKIEQYIK